MPRAVEKLDEMEPPEATAAAPGAAADPAPDELSEMALIVVAQVLKKKFSESNFLFPIKFFCGPLKKFSE